MKRFVAWRPAAVAAAVALVGAFALVPPQGDGERPVPSWLARDPVVRAAQQRFYILADSSNAADRTWELLDSRDRASQVVARAGSVDVQVEAGISQGVAALFVATVREELRSLTNAPAYPVVERLVVDPVSSGFYRPFSSGRYRLATVLPSAPTEPCVVLVRMDSSQQVPDEPNPRMQLLSTCGFYARFGMPGAGMDAWLERTQHLLASHHTFNSAVLRHPESWPPVVKPGLALYAACSMGRADACESLFEGSDLTFVGAPKWVFGTPGVSPEDRRTRTVAGASRWSAPYANATADRRPAPERDLPGRPRPRRDEPGAPQPTDCRCASGTAPWASRGGHRAHSSLEGPRAPGP